jgi:glucuronate isomerase
MRPFIHDDFLLESDVAAELYHAHAEKLPIIDYHCHLPVSQIAEDHRFSSITEIWLYGDHYKWRAMRANGVPERLCTGDASDWEKFEAWARTVPFTLRNPLYHWTHMGLRRRSASRSCSTGGARAPPSTAATRGWQNRLLGRGCSAVLVAVTRPTTRPTRWRTASLAARTEPETRVSQRFGPTACWRRRPAGVELWSTGWSGRWAFDRQLQALLEALESRHAAFHAAGCRASDHGLEQVDAEPWTDRDAAKAFDRLRRGKPLVAGATRCLRSVLLHRLALLDHARGWVQQYHLGALRDNNTRLRLKLGADSGLDSIGDFPQARSLARFLDGLDSTDQLARRSATQPAGQRVCSR